MKLFLLGPAGLVLSGAIAFTIAAPAAGSGASAAKPATAASAEGKVAFAPCSTCHSTAAGKNGIGPSLAGVVGRKLASIPGFAYSSAMKAKGGTWNEAALNAFLAAPGQVVPGTRMFYAGQKDGAKRAALIAYLTTLH